MAKRTPRLSLVAHACVVLAIDPGTTSGWAVFVRGKLVARGKAKTRDERLVAIERALDAHEETGLPVVVVAEKWTAGGWNSWTRADGTKVQGNQTKILLALGKAWGRWEESLEEHGLTLWVRVYPQTWWPRVCGGRRPGSAQAKRVAKAYVVARFNCDVTHDTAEAICIGVWGSHSEPVAKALAGEPEAKPKRTRLRPPGAPEQLGLGFGRGST